MFAAFDVFVRYGPAKEEEACRVGVDLFARRRKELIYRAYDFVGFEIHYHGDGYM